MSVPCPRCEGAGTVLTGPEARALRLASGLSLREVARRCAFDAAYVSDLERDLRPWNATLERQFRAALRQDEPAPFVRLLCQGDMGSGRLCGETAAWVSDDGYYWCDTHRGIILTEEWTRL